MRLRVGLGFIVGTLAILAPLLSCANTPITWIEFGSTIWSADSQRIVFAVSLDEKSEIYSMSLHDSSPRQLTDNDSNESSPAWSPDGRQIAFISDRNGYHDIYVMDADGGNILPATGNRDRLTEYEPTWSPDGRHLAFSTQDAVYTIKSYGRNLEKFPSVSRGVSHKGFAWSPDSTRIVVAEENKGLFVIDIANGNTQKIIDYAVDYAYPDWLSDDRIVFTANLDYPNEWGFWQIYAIDVDGKNRQRLTDSIGVRSLAVSPDKQQIAFQRKVYSSGMQRVTSVPIYVMDADGGNLRQLTDDSYLYLSWSPNGRYLAYTDNGFIHVIDADTGEMQFRYRATDLMPDMLSWEGVLVIIGGLFLLGMGAIGIAWAAVTGGIVIIISLLEQLCKKMGGHKSSQA